MFPSQKKPNPYWLLLGHKTNLLITLWAAGKPKLPLSVCRLPPALWACCCLQLSSPFSCCVLSQPKPMGYQSKGLPGHIQRTLIYLPSWLCFTSCERTRPHGCASSTVRLRVSLCCCDRGLSTPLSSTCPPFLIAGSFHTELPDQKSLFPHWYCFRGFICT